jgi:hypothetical protein
MEKILNEKEEGTRGSKLVLWSVIGLSISPKIMTLAKLKMSAREDWF